MNLREIASKCSPIDVAAFSAHRQSVGHKPREICYQCPQPITNMIVKYGEDQYGIKRRRRQRRGVYN